MVQGVSPDWEDVLRSTAVLQKSCGLEQLEESKRIESLNSSSFFKA